MGPLHPAAYPTIERKIFTSDLPPFTRRYRRQQLHRCSRAKPLQPPQGGHIPSVLVHIPFNVLSGFGFHCEAPKVQGPLHDTCPVIFQLLNQVDSKLIWNLRTQRRHGDRQHPSNWMGDLTRAVIPFHGTVQLRNQSTQRYNRRAATLSDYRAYRIDP